MVSRAIGQGGVQDEHIGARGELRKAWMQAGLITGEHDADPRTFKPIGERRCGTVRHRQGGDRNASVFEHRLRCRQGHRKRVTRNANGAPVSRPLNGNAPCAPNSLSRKTGRAGNASLLLSGPAIANGCRRSATISPQRKSATPDA